MRIHSVTCTGFEPVNAALRGQCVKPLHQHARHKGRCSLPSAHIVYTIPAFNATISSWQLTEP